MLVYTSTKDSPFARSIGGRLGGDEMRALTETLESVLRSSATTVSDEDKEAIARLQPTQAQMLRRRLRLSVENFDKFISSIKSSLS